jgi:hypothetical protein
MRLSLHQGPESLKAILDDTNTHTPSSINDPSKCYLLTKKPDEVDPIQVKST